MMEFKPPWNYFPVHYTQLPPFTVWFEVGIDQGDLITYSCVLTENGVAVWAGGFHPRWRVTLLSYLDMIEHAKWRIKEEQLRVTE